MRALFVFIFALFAFSKIPDAPKNTIVFGAKITIGDNSSICTFEARRYDSSGNIRERKIYRKDDFIKIICGEWPSSFNPERKNLFKEHNILGGMLIFDSVTMKKVPFCPALDSLWKIRYDVYPFRGNIEYGWARGSFGPSLNQKAYLGNRYNINIIDHDLVMDTCFWMMLRDVRDSLWIADYKAK